MTSKFVFILIGAAAILLIIGYITFSNGVLITRNKYSTQTAKSDQTSSKTPDTKNLLDTSKWKIYINDLYKYSIKYPSDWEIITEDKKWVTEFSPIGEDYYIEGEPKIGVIRISAAPDVKFDSSKYPNTQQVIIDGQSAYKQSNGYLGEVVIYFHINGIPISLVNDVSPAVTSSQNRDKANEYNRIYDMMVSTFKFIKH